MQVLNAFVNIVVALFQLGNPLTHGVNGDANRHEQKPEDAECYDSTHWGWVGPVDWHRLLLEVRLLQTLYFHLDVLLFFRRDIH